MNITAKVKMETTSGDFIIGLYGDEMPVSVKNFLSYVEEGFYDGIIFHRIIPNFVIQGGGFYPKMQQKQTKQPIKLEISPNIKHIKYVLSMARTQVRDSGTSQFFICTGNVPSLDNQYAAFGIITDGFDVIDKMANVRTKTVGYFQDVPVEDIIINKAYIIE